MFNRSKFFAGFKAHFDSSLDQGQVDGIEFLLSRFESDTLWTSDLRNIAYALATIYHETAGSMQPVEEGYYLGRYGQKRVKDFQKSLRYFPYFGRGYVQLTWKTNYEKAGAAIGVDLADHPEKALDKETAFQVLTLGMFRGWFSAGNKLGKYIHGDTCDYKGARRIINGTDKASLIAGYAERFEKLLNSAVAPSNAQTPTSELGAPTESKSGIPLDANSGTAAEHPPGQVAEQIINTGDTDIPKIVAAQNADVHEVEDSKKTGIVSKIWAFIILVFTGQATLPTFVTDSDSGFWGIVARIFAGLWEFKVYLLGALFLWFIVVKLEATVMKAIAAKYNTDPTRSNILLVPPAKKSWLEVIRFW